MAISRALDSNNDISFKNGSSFMVEDGAEVVQHIRSRLLFYKEEWFLDTDAGVPYFQEIFTKPFNLARTESTLKREILQTPGVEKLTQFSIDFNANTRKLTVTFSAETTFGTVEGATINV